MRGRSSPPQARRGSSCFPTSSTRTEGCFTPGTTLTGASSFYFVLLLGRVSFCREGTDRGRFCVGFGTGSARTCTLGTQPPFPLFFFSLTVMRRRSKPDLFPWIHLCDLSGVPVRFFTSCFRPLQEHNTDVLPFPRIQMISSGTLRNRYAHFHSHTNRRTGAGRLKDLTCRFLACSRRQR